MKLHVFELDTKKNSKGIKAIYFTSGQPNNSNLSTDLRIFNIA